MQDAWMCTTATLPSKGLPCRDGKHVQSTSDVAIVGGVGVKDLTIVFDLRWLFILVWVCVQKFDSYDAWMLPTSASCRRQYAASQVSFAPYVRAGRRCRPSGSSNVGRGLHWSLRCGLCQWGVSYVALNRWCSVVFRSPVMVVGRP